MTEKALAVRGVVFNWLGRGCALCITFFLTPYLVTTLGDESYGLWSMVMAFTSYYALADMGLRGAGVKYIAQYYAVDDYESVNRVAVSSTAVYSALAALVMVVVVIASFVFPQTISLGDIAVSDMQWVVLLTGATMVTRLLTQVFGATLTALQRHDIGNVLAVVIQLLNAAAVVTALAAGYGLVGMAVATFTTTVFGQLLRTWFAFRILPQLSISPRYFDRDTLKTVFQFSGVNMMANVAARVLVYAGGLFVGYISGPAFVLLYTIPEMITQKSAKFGTAITQVLDPLASQLNAKQNRSALLELMVLPPRLLTVLSLSLAIFFVLFGESVIRLWLGPQYVNEMYPVLCVLAMARAFKMSTGGLRAVLRSTAQLRVIAVAAAVEVAVTLVFGLIGVWYWGPIGMAWAIFTAQFLVGIVLLPKWTCMALEMPANQYYLSLWPASLLSLLPVLSVAMILNHYWVPGRLLELAVILLAILLSAGLSAFFICLPTHRRADIRSSLSLNRSAKSA